MMDATAHLHHELRTPLNHIIGYAEMLLEEAAARGHEAMESELRAIRAEAQRLLTATRDVLVPGAAIPTELAAPLRAIREGVERTRAAATGAGFEDVLADLDRIATACDRLEALLRDLGSPVTESRAPARGPAASIGAAPPSPAQRAVGRILFVDDNDGNREILERRLRREGHTVTVAASGEEALRFLEAHTVDLVLLDVLMPGLDGYAVLQRMKADERLRSLPVLVISALDEIDTVVRCIELGADDYLTKPFEAVLLRARVGTCLEKKRLRDQEVRYLEELGQWNRTLEQRVAEQVTMLDRLGRMKRFFAPQVAELIVSGGADELLKTHRRQITVVFIDLRGFTAFAETAEPEELMDVLHEYNNEMGRLVLEHEGTLERFTGDGMMIFFNDPIVVPDPAERAVRMAVAMRERVLELSARWRKHGWDLGLGIGIADGYATIGAIGFEGRWDYTAIGTVTNLAARLCAEAKAGQILVTSRVATALEGRIEAEEIGPLRLKGLTKPVAALNIVGIAAR